VLSLHVSMILPQCFFVYIGLKPYHSFSFPHFGGPSNLCIRQVKETR
jgi:hypothetical protein